MSPQLLDPRQQERGFSIAPRRLKSARGIYDEDGAFKLVELFDALGGFDQPRELTPGFSQTFLSGA